MASTGFELLFNSVKLQVHQPQDSILCVCHWQIVSAGFKCVGIGENKSLSDDEEGTEMLPEGWSSSPDLYVWRYQHTSTGKLYIFKVITVDNSLLVHFWRDQDENVATMNVMIEDYATLDFSSYKKAVKNVDDLAKRFKKEVLDQVIPSSPRAGTSQRGGKSKQRPAHEDNDPLRVPDRRGARPRPDWIDPDDPFAVGRSDLDPLGGMGGGMLFDPMRGGRGPRFGMDPSAGLPSRLPPGAVPPGARFDPFGPPGTHPGQRPGPDPDHMKPPDYDDMFM